LKEKEGKWEREIFAVESGVLDYELGGKQAQGSFSNVGATCCSQSCRVADRIEWRIRHECFSFSD